jgi:catechol 2,3-dioxygenase-like lactoylglutathione lyase family enzyme
VIFNPIERVDMLFSIKALDHIVLIVSDIEESLNFYIDVLGCKLIRKIEEPELYQLKAGASLIDLTSGVKEHTEPNVDHFCLAIEPFDSAVLIPYLKDLGVPCGEVARRFGATGFGDSIYIEDPDGNRVELKAS